MLSISSTITNKNDYKLIDSIIESDTFFIVIIITYFIGKHLQHLVSVDLRNLAISINN